MSNDNQRNHLIYSTKYNEFISNPTTATWPYQQKTQKTTATFLFFMIEKTNVTR